MRIVPRGKNRAGPEAAHRSCRACGYPIRALPAKRRHCDTCLAWDSSWRHLQAMQAHIRRAMK